jgi:transposase-like protein
MRKLRKKQGFAPKLLAIDKLRSYASAFRRLRLTYPHARMSVYFLLSGSKATGFSATRTRQDVQARAWNQPQLIGDWR